MKKLFTLSFLSIGLLAFAQSTEPNDDYSSSESSDTYSDSSDAEPQDSEDLEILPPGQIKALMEEEMHRIKEEANTSESNEEY